MNKYQEKIYKSVMEQLDYEGYITQSADDILLRRLCELTMHRLCDKMIEDLS